MDFRAFLRGKQYWVIRLRFIFALVLAGSYFLRINQAELFHQTFAMIATTAMVVIVLASNVIWLILLRNRGMFEVTLGYYQCIFDLVVVSLIVHQHGASGPAGYLFVLVILVAGLLLPKQGVVLMAAASCVMYIVTLLLEMYGIIVPIAPILGGIALLPESIRFTVDIAIKGFFFYLVAFACSNLQELLDKMNREATFLSDFNQNIVNMSPYGILVIDPSHVIALFNPELEQSTGIAGAGALGRPLGDVFPGIEPMWIQAVDNVVATGEEIRLARATLPVPGGEARTVNARFRPMRVDNATIAVVCTVQAETA